ncbi:MAG TPA: type VI secretion system-associated protein TagO [Xanthobacteraceae bacterium]
MLASVAATMAIDAGTAGAQDADSLQGSLLKCGKIASDLQRLDCYDKLVVAKSADTPAKTGDAKTGDAKGSGDASSAAAVGDAKPDQSAADSSDAKNDVQWDHREETSGLDHSKTEVTSIMAVKGYVGNLNRAGLRRNPVLVIRCREHKTNVYVSYDTSVAGASGEVPVQYRIGDQPVVKASWAGSQDHNGYGVWSSGPAIKLIKSMLSSDEFFVRADVRIMGSSEALFKLKGIEDAVKPVREACDW